MRPKGTGKTGMKSLTDSQLLDFIKTVEKAKKPRDIILFKLTVWLGLRVQEVCNIEVNHVDVGEGSIFIQGIKNGRKRTYVFDKELRLWRKVFRLKINQLKINSPYLFSSPKDKEKPISTQAVKMLFKRYAKKAGLPESFSIHSLRHTIGRMMAHKKFTAIQIMHWLRHRNVISTQVYFEGVSFKEDDRRMATDFATFL